MSILVTGGSGAIGSWVVRRLLEEGQKPVVFDLRPNTALIEDIKKDVPIVQGDVTDWAKIVRTLREHKIERMIHLAAELSPEVRKSDPYLEVKVIVDGTVNILEASRLLDVQKVVFASSRAVYGVVNPKYTKPPYDPIPEEEAKPGGSTAIYSSAKFLLERVGLQYASLGLETAALRFGTIYGPGKIMTHGEKKTRATHALLVVNAMRGQPTKVERGGDGITDCVYCKDVANGIVKALFTQNLQTRIYNISSGEGASLKDWAKVVKGLFPNASVEVGPGPLTELGMGGGILDISKARKELSYKPEYPLQKGIEDFVREMDRLKLIG
ncbi:MAG: NAD(P)-dependent oxidoreductase [Deltaproteobacteria bacterium]